MTYYLKNYTRFKVCGTESLLRIYIPFCFLEREEKGTAFMLGAVSDFYLNVIQGIHLDKKKAEKFCFSLKKVWFLMTVLYSIVRKDRHFSQIYIFEVICVQLSNVLNIHLCVGELLGLKYNSC